MGTTKAVRPPILIAAAECSPFAKTGGLADVIGTLPKALAKEGYDVRVIMPYHRVIKERYGHLVKHLCSFSVELGWRSQYVGLEKLETDGGIHYLIDNEYYFGDCIYRGGNSGIEQYAYFCRAVLEAISKLDYAPKILHVNDWHTAMIPLLLKTQYQDRPEGELKTLLTIHNLAYQGKCGFVFLQELLGLPEACNNSGGVESFGAANCLKAGCVYADKLNTVSRTYAQEIKSNYYGEGLEGVLNLRSADLSGILNGIDYKEFDPTSDPSLPQPYSLSDLCGKYCCKESLCTELGLHYDPDIPLVAMVTRLTPQKGFDLLSYVLDEIMRERLCFVVLGCGDVAYETLLRNAEARYRGRFCAYIGYRDDLAHRVYAGADFYLMPSKFEPCGISQLIALRYGTLPIVRETGGLKDTVLPYNKYTGEGTGFSFANENTHEMLDAIRRALAVYRDKDAMQTLIEHAMCADFSFRAPAKAYAKLYETLIS